MKKLIAVFLLATAAQVQAATLIVRTDSESPICVYVDAINELCATKKESKSITINPGKHSMMGVNKQGTVASKFYELTIPETAKTVTVDTQEEDGKITLVTKTPRVKLTEE